jgi:hypothetical protein
MEDENETAWVFKRLMKSIDQCRNALHLERDPDRRIELERKLLADMRQLEAGYMRVTNPRRR